MLKSVSKYYYTQLDNASQRVYNEIFSAWKAYNPSATFVQKTSQIDIQKIVNYISHDNPVLFYVDFRRISVSTLGAKATVQANFLFDKPQIIHLEKQIENIVSQLLSNHKFNTLDDYKKEMILHDFLVKSVSYASVTSSESTSVIGALISKKAVCEGYAEAFKLLCDQVGLPCIVVSGMATPQNRLEERHAWNIVRINGVYAHVDVTWDSTTKGDDDYCYDHLNLTDDDIAKDHCWDRALLPVCTSSEYNYYRKNNLCLRDLSEFKHVIISKLSQGIKMIAVKILSQGITQNQIMQTAQSAITDSFPQGCSIELKHNPQRGTVKMAVK